MERAGGLFHAHLPPSEGVGGFSMHISLPPKWKSLGGLFPPPEWKGPTETSLASLGSGRSALPRGQPSRQVPPEGKAVLVVDPAGDLDPAFKTL